MISIGGSVQLRYLLLTVIGMALNACPWLGIDLPNLSAFSEPKPLMEERPKHKTANRNSIGSPA